MYLDDATNVLIVEESRLRNIVHEEVQTALQMATQEVREQACGTYTRKQASEILKISLPTLTQMVKDGILHPSKIKGRVLFSKYEVSNLMEGARA